MANINKIKVENTIYDIAPSSTSTNDFTSTDVADGSATSWTTVSPLTSGETTGSILNKISSMFSNIRYLYANSGGSSSTNINVTLNSSDWTLNNISGYYTQSITSQGITSNSKIKIDGIIYPSGTTLDTKLSIDYAASLILGGTSSANTITFNAVSMPESDLTLELEVK